MPVLFSFLSNTYFFHMRPSCIYFSGLVSTVKEGQVCMNKSKTNLRQNLIQFSWKRWYIGKKKKKEEKESYMMKSDLAKGVA